MGDVLEEMDHLLLGSYGIVEVLLRHLEEFDHHFPAVFELLLWKDFLDCICSGFVQHHFVEVTESLLIDLVLT